MVGGAKAAGAFSPPSSPSTKRLRPPTVFFVLATAAVLVVSLILVTWQSGTTAAMQHISFGDLRSAATLATTSSSISGVSGKLFAGVKQRTYPGPTLLQAADAVAVAADASPAGQRNKWGVCTTIFKPSQAILGVAALPDWQLVVVGDEGGAPFAVNASNTVFLDVQAQQQLAGKYGGLLKLLPWRHFGRKNVGYLYAIMHGADAIWDFDDDNVLKPGARPAVPTTNVQVLSADTTAAASACEAFNPYPHMGAPSAAPGATGVPPSWPRGFPLQLIRQPCNTSLQPAGDAVASRIAVVQSLADNDPDVDGIYRLTRGVPFSFRDAKEATVVIPHGTLTPWNAQATLFLRPALWALLLPVTVHGRVSDIWRSYVAQRLLWDVGYNIAFAPPMVDQFRSPHNYLADMQAEEPLYMRSGQLVKLLRSWQGTAPTIAGRFEELMVELYERLYVEYEDVALTQQWLKALAAAGYTFPPLESQPLADSAMQVERPWPDSKERTLTSPQFEAAQVASLNPPPSATGSASQQVLVKSRLVIGIAAGIHSGGADVSAGNVDQLQLVKIMFRSFLPTVNPGYVYRFYLAFDSVDPVFSQPSVRTAVEKVLSTAVAAEDAKRPHPAGYKYGSSIDASVLVVTLHWVSCPYTGKPAWAQNDAAVAAFKEGADYVLRTNDDTQLPANSSWVTEFIRDLRSRRPVPNLGVVGPLHKEGNTEILTHDFVHRTHLLVHGFHYPRSFPTWYADDWITKVYSGYSHPPLMVKRADLPVVHTLSPTRYNVSVPANIQTILLREVAKGKQAIKAFALKHYRVSPMH